MQPGRTPWPRIQHKYKQWASALISQILSIALFDVLLSNKLDTKNDCKDLVQPVIHDTDPFNRQYNYSLRWDRPYSSSVLDIRPYSCGSLIVISLFIRMYLFGLTIYDFGLLWAASGQDLNVAPPSSEWALIYSMRSHVRRLAPEYILNFVP